jgi:hypothetical protein
MRKLPKNPEVLCQRLGADFNSANTSLGAGLLNGRQMAHVWGRGGATTAPTVAPTTTPNGGTPTPAPTATPPPPKPPVTVSTSKGKITVNVSNSNYSVFGTYDVKSGKVGGGIIVYF